MKNDFNLFISPLASIGENVLIGSSVNIFGDCIIGDNAIIENNVTIGHPSFLELNKLEKKKFSSLCEYYESACKSVTTKILKNAVIRSNSVVYSGCKIGKYFDCGHNVVVRENCLIGEHVYLFVNTEFKREVKIGNYCRIAGTLCDRTKIGNNTSMFGHTVHKYLIGVGGYKEKAPIIGDGVIVGREAVLIGDIKIRNYTVIASNSVLTKSTPESSVFAGIPARLIKYRDKEEYKILEQYEEGNEKTSTFRS
jgi:acetyltransferase-like isoleucine patch superfamily enzyme